MRIIGLLIVVLSVLVLPAGLEAQEKDAAKAAQADAVMERGRDLTTRFYSNELDGIFSEFSDEMKQEVSLAKLNEIRAQAHSMLGAESGIVSEKLGHKNDSIVYVRQANFEKFGGVVEVVWYLREPNEIAGFFIRPVEPGAEGSSQ